MTHATAALVLCLIAGLANAEDQLALTSLAPDGAKAPKGYVFCNGLTGERVVSFKDAGPVAARGSGWAWNSSYADPCFPASVGGEDDQIYWLHAMHAQSLGDGGVPTPDDPGAWQDWIEHPGDSVISLISFGLWTAVPDPEEDGVAGQEMLLVFTENDRAPERLNAIASTAIAFTELPGADDENGDGEIGFDESNLWVMVYDLAAGDAPFDVEIGDSNGTYDGSYPDTGSVGPPGTDVDGDGLIDSGFVMAWRQPGVAEGDPLILRFPELAGLGIQNPDGLDASTFGNMHDVGIALAHPSGNAGVEGEPDCYDANNTAGEWPRVPGCDDGLPFPVGSWDAYALIDSTGVDTGAFWFGGFDCDPDTPGPPYNTPWANPMIGFNIDLSGPHVEPCDLNGDGVADLQDIVLFIHAFQSGAPIADINGDGLFDLEDISAFVIAFLSGCP